MTSPYEPPEPGQPQPQGPPPPGYGSQPGGYGAPPADYGNQPGYGQPTRPQRNGFGVAALVLGILAIVTSITVIGGVVLGVLAVIFGVIGRGRATRGEANNGGLALAGIITGIIGVLLSAALIAFGVSVLNSDEGKDLQNCLDSAGDSTSQQQDCANQFQQDIQNR